MHTLSDLYQGWLSDSNSWEYGLFPIAAWLQTRHKYSRVQSGIIARIIWRWLRSGYVPVDKVRE